MADGSIIIDTRIDTGGVSKGLNAVKAGMTRISAQVSKMGDSAKSSFQRQITAITDLYQNYEKQERKVSELKSKLEELSKVRIETEEYKKLKDDIKALEDEFEKVETKQREWLDTGFSINSAPLQELDKQMDDIWADIDRLQRKQKEMQTTGRAYVDPTSTDAYKSTAEKYNVESQKLEHINGRLYSSYNKLKNKVAEYRQKNSRLVQVMQNLQKAAARVGMVVKNMGSALRSAGSAIKSMVSAMKKAVENMFNLNKQTDRSRMSLSRMLGMSLLFSGVFRAISAVSDGVKTGFENLAQYSNSTNSAISSLMSSMTRLKNSFATAFAPVLTVVAPIMSRFIDMISRAITYVGMFAAALTGQDTFVKAVGVQEDYAAGLEKTSKNTNQAAKSTKKTNKETEGYLSTLDEIQRYTSNKNDDSAADGNGTDDLSDHIEDAIQDFRLGNQHGGYGDGRIQLATGHAGEDGGDCGICQAGSQREEHDIDAIHGRTPCGEGVNGKAQQEAAGQFGAHAQSQRLLLGFFHDCSFLFICWKTGEPAQTVASLAAVLRCGMIYRLELTGIPVRQL